MDTLSKHLMLQGAIVLLIALCLGAPYARAIKRNADAQAVNSWRVVHQSLTIGAILLLVLAPVLSYMPVAVAFKWAIAVLFIVSSYAFALSTPLAAITKDRGLVAGARGLARGVYLGNMLGALTSLAGAVLLVTACVWVMLSA